MHSLEGADFQEKFASSIRPKEVRLRLLAAPINPADINMIQGTVTAYCTCTHNFTGVATVLVSCTAPSPLLARVKRGCARDYCCSH